MKRIKLYSAIVAIAAFFAVVASNPVSAETVSTTLTVSPRYQKIILVPGEKYQGTITVSNGNQPNRDLVYSVSVGSFNQEVDQDKGEYGNVDINTVSSFNQIMDWIELDREAGTVAPNGNQVVTFSINVPYDAPAGGQYATLVVRNDTDMGGNNGNVAIQQNFQFASIIYAEVAGETRDTGEIIENNAPSFLLDGSSFEATSMVKNTGNVHTNAEYTLQVWPLFSGEEICTNEEEPETSLILPDTQRYHSQKCSLPAIGIFNIKQTVKIFDQVSTIEKMVIVCPIWLLFIVLFVIILAIVYVVSRAKKRKE